MGQQVAAEYLCWSFNPETETLDVWDSKNGEISHFGKFGSHGLLVCAQGRIYENCVTIYGNRPLALEGETADALRKRAREVVDRYLLEEGAQREWRTVY